MFGWAIVSKEKMALGQRTLRMGMKGRDVGELQKFLLKMGFYEGPVDESFGLMTEEAVADLERALGVRVDGRFGPNLIRLLNRPPSAGGWIVHRVKNGESLKSIAERYGVKATVFGGYKRLQRHMEGALFVPEKKLWIWADEYRPEMICTGLLTEETGQNAIDGDRLPVRKIVAVDEFLKDKKRWMESEAGAWIIDVRQAHQRKIRQVVEAILHWRTGNKPWIWLSDLMLEAPGSLTFLKLHSRTGLGGIVIELNPPVGELHKKIRPGYAWMKELRQEPLLFSVNLMPRLDWQGERRLITAKESRLWRYRATEKNPAHIGRYQWAMLPIQDGADTGRLWLVDSATMNALYVSLIQDDRSGLVLEGLRGVDSRILKIYQDYFAIGNSGHETTLRDIYLKRDNM